MKQRCYNKNRDCYDNYGGRGIIVCDEWKDSFSNFYFWAIKNGYSDDLTIDRIDVDGNYEPNNCRWATRKIQDNNRRTNRYITIDGITHTLEEWIDIYGMSKNTVRQRIKRGWDDNDLFLELDSQERYIEISGQVKSLNEWSQFSGIPKSNIIDRLHKGLKGKNLIKPLRTRLNFNIATEIRNFHKMNPELTYSQIAKEFNVKSSATISDILNNKSYYDRNYIVMEVRDN